MNNGQVKLSTLVAAALVTTTLVSSMVQAQIRYVDDDAPLGGDGLSWDTAYRFLQDALSEAADDPMINTVRGAQGTYRPDQDESGNVTLGDRGATFPLIGGLALMGGYAGLGAPDPDARDIDLYTTILTGDLLGDDGPGFKNNGDNAYHVLIVPSTGGESLLEGFLIVGGTADGGFPMHNKGGGLYTNGGGVTVAACTFEGNSAAHAGGAVFAGASAGPVAVTACSFFHNAANILGGAISAINLSSALTVAECQFVENSADIGGAISAQNSNFEQCCDSTFVENSATVRGGAIYSGGSFGELMDNCTFIGNVSANGGAISQPRFDEIRNCVFQANVASEDYGGAIAFALFSSFVNCVFVDNHAEVRGGAIYSFCSSTCGSLIAESCIFAGNTAGGYGGAVWLRFTAETSRISNSVFVGNEANLEGGAIHISVNDPDFVLANCSLSSNSTVGDGGAVFTRHATTKVSNTILFGNTDSSGNQEQAQLFIGPGGVVLAEYSCIAGLTGSLPGTGNIGDDPLFANPVGPDGIVGTPDDDLRLSPGSPCIDAADNTAVPKGITTDLDGNPRFVDDPDTEDTGNGDPPVVDMGAYEFQPPDADGDGIPDDEDSCPDSDLVETIVIDGCDSGVENMLFDDGCTMADLIAECAAGVSNHGDFVSCVAQLTNEWKHAGLITGQEKGAIQSCAAQSTIPGGLPLVSGRGVAGGGGLCLADTNGDGVTNVLDLIALLLCFGQPAVPGCEAEDVNADGTINVLDLIDLLLAFGTACP